MPVVLELGKILGGFFAAIVACALGPAAGFNSCRKATCRARITKVHGFRSSADYPGISASHNIQEEPDLSYHSVRVSCPRSGPADHVANEHPTARISDAAHSRFAYEALYQTGGRSV